MENNQTNTNLTIHITNEQINEKIGPKAYTNFELVSSFKKDTTPPKDSFGSIINLLFSYLKEKILINLTFLFLILHPK